MNFYEYLEIKPQATSEEIKHAFRELAKKTHPDYNKQDSAFWDMVELNMIRDTLLNPTKRAKYDLMLQSGKGVEEFQTPSAHTSPESKKEHHTVAKTVKNFFTYHCKVCGIEMKSTWKGYCLHHYLEATGQLNNPENTFEYGGYKYKWVDPSEPEDLPPHRHHQQPHHFHKPVNPHPIYIAAYAGIILLLLGIISVYMLMLLQMNK
jgi:curved DNA-binding protein CbpA